MVDTGFDSIIRDTRNPLRPRHEGLSYPAIEAVMAHWNALRGDATAPARADLDPRAMTGALDVLFVAELVAPTVARLRLTGQRLFDLVGMEPRGMPLSVFLAHDARAALDDALRQVAMGARVVLPLRAARGLARPAIDARMLLLPLTDHHGAINRVLGVLEYHGQVGRAPRTLSLAAPLHHVTTQAPAQPIPARATHRPALRVIKGGKA